jgi:hypothetical protein
VPSSQDVTPRGCLINCVLTDSNQLTPPVTPANHQLAFLSAPDQLSDLTSHNMLPSISVSVVHIKCRPCVFGLWHDNLSTVRIKKLLSLIDGGANICLTNNLQLLVDAINIQPLPITVALDNKVTLDDCCTKRGFIPLTLADGSIHWQICYYCTNTAETIISLQAILASNDAFASWTMTGFKDGTPGSIRFNSHDGLLAMSLTLDCKYGLYYCPTDVFTTD